MTLGSFSLFRGLAEGLTGGVENFTVFPASFLFLGQGYLLGRHSDAAAAVRRRGRWRSGGCCIKPTIGRGAVGHRLLAGRGPLCRAFRSSDG